MVAAMALTVNAQGRDDFSTLEVHTSYGNDTTAAGWIGENVAVFSGGEADGSGVYTAIGSSDATKAMVMRGRTDANGVITSPILTGGIGTLSFKTAYFFNESNGINFNVAVKQNGAIVTSYDIVDANAEKGTAYAISKVFSLDGDFQIVFTNNNVTANTSGNKDRYAIWDVEWTANSGETPIVEVAAPVITPATGTYNEPQTVTITAAEGCRIYYTLDGSEPNDAATAYSEPFVVSETTTVKAVAVNEEDTQSAVATSVITINVLKSIANTIETAYTTAEAIALIDDPTSDLSDSVYVKGVVSNVDSYNSKYSSLTYWLDDKAFEIYSGKGLNGEDPQSEEYLAATDTVIVYGVIKKYRETYEMDKNNYIVYIGKGPGPSVSIANTPETAYTVAKAFELIDAGVGLDEKVYVKGTISSIKEVSVDWGNATYFISDDGTTTNELEIYRGYSVGGEKFAAEDEIKVGDVVIVYGKLVLYGTTYEFTTGSSIYSLNGSTSAIKRVSQDKAIDLGNAVIYNVLGKRVSDMSKKGIYIVNGKKYVVK